MTFINDTYAALQNWALELLQNKRFQEAAVFSQVLSGKRPHKAALGLAEEMGIVQQKPIIAIEFLEFILETKNIKQVDVEKFEIYQLMARIFSGANEAKESVKHFYNALNLLPKHKNYDHARQSVEYQLASQLAAIGELTEAQSIFDKDLPVECGNGWITSTKIINFNFGEHRAGEPPSSNTKTLFDRKSGETAIKMVYLVAADIKYFTKFAPDLLKALIEFEAQGIHLHLCGISIGETSEGHKKWANFTDALIENSDFTEVSFSITHSVLSVPIPLTDVQKKSIFSFERFRVLPDILRQYNVPLLVADIDQTPLLSPLSLIHDDFDFALLNYPNSVLNILSSISATVSMFKPTPKGLVAADKLKAYFDNTFLEKKALNWHVDQAGLAVLALTNQDAKILYLKDKLVTSSALCAYDNALSRGAFFWSITNSLTFGADQINQENPERLLND